MMEAGNLIRIVRRPTDDPRAQEPTFWCERAGMRVHLQIGSVGVVVDAHARSTIGNEIIIFMQGGEFYSICRYDLNFPRREPAWCEVLDEAG